MKAIVCDSDILKSLDPNRVVAYLEAHQWHKRTNVPQQVSTWTRDTFSNDKLKIYLPLDKDFDDYPRRMYEIVETLEKAENRSQLDILSELVTHIPNITIQGMVTQVQNQNTNGKLGGEVAHIYPSGNRSASMAVPDGGRLPNREGVLEYPSGEVFLMGIVVDKLRKIKTELIGQEYLLAQTAYQERSPIRCTGDLIKEGDSFVLQNPHDFSLESI